MIDTMGRIFNPVEITEHLTEEQVNMLAAKLDMLCEHGYGEVTITVSNHHVNKVLVRLDEKLPLPNSS